MSSQNEVNEEVEKNYALYEEYTKQQREGLIYQGSASDELKYVDIRDHFQVFEKYMDWIKKNFSKKSISFNVSDLVRIMGLRFEGSEEKREKIDQWMLMNLQVFEKIPTLMRLISKQNPIEIKNIENNRNRFTRQRIALGSKSDPQESEAQNVCEMVDFNRDLYKRFDEKYKNIGDKQIVICNIFSDAELCLRFLNRHKTDEERSPFSDDIELVAVMIRPSQTKTGSTFLGYEIQLSRSGLVVDNDNDTKGIVFLAPDIPNINKSKRIDELSLLELILEDLPPEEISSRLETDENIGVNRYIFN